MRGLALVVAFLLGILDITRLLFAWSFPPCLNAMAAVTFFPESTPLHNKSEVPLGVPFLNGISIIHLNTVST